MELLFWILVALAVFFVFAYFRMPLAWWTLAAGLMLVYLSAIAQLSLVSNIVLFTLFAAAALALNVRPIRRALISDRILAIYRRILPDMSQTEKEAIDAGTV